MGGNCASRGSCAGLVVSAPGSRGRSANRTPFNTVFSMMSKQGKQDLIERWMIKKKCSRGHAMRLALEDWRSDRANR
jgi:hypothetical protein